MVRSRWSGAWSWQQPGACELRARKSSGGCSKHRHGGHRGHREHREEEIRTQGTAFPILLLSVPSVLSVASVLLKRSVSGNVGRRRASSRASSAMRIGSLSTTTEATESTEGTERKEDWKRRCLRPYLFFSVLSVSSVPSVPVLTATTAPTCERRSSHAPGCCQLHGTRPSGIGHPHVEPVSGAGPEHPPKQIHHHPVAQPGQLRS